jgi:Domain of unknown function (DUF4209)
MELSGVTIATLEQVAEKSDGLDLMGSRLQQLVTEENRDELDPFVVALSYLFVEQGEEELRGRSEGAFGAAMEFDNRRFPPRLEDLGEDVPVAWEAALASVKQPALVARLQDLLWVARRGERPDLHARAAVDAYLMFAGREEWPAIDRADALSRAIELSRSVGDQKRGAISRDAIVAMAEAELRRDPGAEERGPGVIFTLLRALRVSKLIDPEDLDGLLLRTGLHFSGDQHVADSVADLREAHLDLKARREMRRERVAAWRQAAADAQGLVRVAHLEHALEIARTHGLKEDQDDLLRELQEISEDELELKEFSTEISVPTEELEAFIEAFIDEDGGWRGSLTRFGNAGPPGGSEIEVNARVDELMSEAPIQFLVRKVVYGPDAAAIFEAVDQESHRLLAVAEQRAFATRFWALSAVRVLERIKEKQGTPPAGELAEFFTTDLIPSDLAAPMARSIELYWRGEFDEAGHMLAPRLERAVRELARRVGLPIIRPPRGLRAGGVRMMGDLLESLKGTFADDSWRSYLRSLLADPLGMNLRNIVAHDLQPTSGQGDVALMIHAACFLRLLGASVEGPAEA